MSHAEVIKDPNKTTKEESLEFLRLQVNEHSTEKIFSDSQQIVEKQKQQINADLLSMCAGYDEHLERFLTDLEVQLDYDPDKIRAEKSKIWEARKYTLEGETIELPQEANEIKFDPTLTSHAEILIEASLVILILNGHRYLYDPKYFGKGATGLVHVAIDLDTDRPKAIKLQCG